MTEKCSKDSQGCWCCHASDCAVHNEPAYPAGECNCGKEDGIKHHSSSPTPPDENHQGIS